MTTETKADLTLADNPVASNWRTKAKGDMRERQLSEQVYQFVFELLDAEPELSGNDAGKVAAHTQREFERKYAAMMGVER